MTLVQGQVIDYFTRKPIQGVVVTCSASKEIVTTDENGFFEMSATEGKDAVFTYTNKNTGEIITSHATVWGEQIHLLPVAMKTSTISESDNIDVPVKNDSQACNCENPETKPSNANKRAIIGFFAGLTLGILISKSSKKNNTLNGVVKAKI